MLARDELFASNRAVYLPAISKGFAEFAQGGTFARAMPWTAGQLNFLDRANAETFHYPYALYSAGQASKAETRKIVKPCIVAQRDRSDTIIVGDSGGFQVQGNTIQFKGDGTTRRLMGWMEEHADYSMVLDFPTGGIKSGNVIAHAERLTADGLDLVRLSNTNDQFVDFRACLEQTKRNNALFHRERKVGATQFLNVLQGRNESESKAWFDEITAAPPFEGWAFAGVHNHDLTVILRRLLDMKAAGILSDLPWLHVLGQSELEFGVVLTSIQRAVRRTCNPRFQISFDSASPFISAAKFQLYSSLTSDNQGWSMQGISLASEGLSADNRSVDDVCSASVRVGVPRSWRHAERLVTSVDTSVGKLPIASLYRDTTATVPDTDGVQLAMHHNVQALTSAHVFAHQIYEEEYKGVKPLLPASVVIVDKIIQMVFEAPSSNVPNAFDLIDQCAAQLDAVGAGRRYSI